MIAVLLKDKDYFDKVITSTEGEKIKNKNELKLQIISEFDEARGVCKGGCIPTTESGTISTESTKHSKKSIIKEPSHTIEGQALEMEQALKNSIEWGGPTYVRLFLRHNEERRPG